MFKHLWHWSSRETPADAGSDSRVLISEGIRLKGELAFGHSGQMHAHHEGNLYSDHKLILGEHSDIRGDLQTGTCEIFGTVHGSLDSNGDVVLHPGSTLQGDLRGHSLRIDADATFRGAIDISPGAPTPLLTYQRSWRMWSRHIAELRQALTDFLKKLFRAKQ